MRDSSTIFMAIALLLFLYMQTSFVQELGSLGEQILNYANSSARILVEQNHRE